MMFALSGAYFVRCVSTRRIEEHCALLMETWSLMFIGMADQPLIVVLRIKAPQLCRVPGVTDEFVCLRVLQAVRASADDFCDDEGSLPWGGELVHLLLLEPEY